MLRFSVWRCLNSDSLSYHIVMLRFSLQPNGGVRVFLDMFCSSLGGVLKNCICCLFVLQRQMSVAQIVHSERTEKGKLKPGGLSDPRLGTTDRMRTCETCTANTIECTGHFGHLELAKPMFHIGFMKPVLSILRCVCFNCSKILLSEVV